MKFHDIADMEMEEKALDEMQANLGYRFTRRGLLRTALTHSSFVNETDEVHGHNERLEFLGDAVLELCVSEELFRRFPRAREGELTRLRAQLVSKPALADMALELKLDRHIRLGRGEEEQGGRTRSSLLSDALEALLGAVFLDSGYETAKRVVCSILAEHWPSQTGEEKIKDNKSRLQELTQQLFRERPVYALLGSHGPEHDKVFDVSVTLPCGTVLYASGPSVKRAEQAAAGAAILKLNARTNNRKSHCAESNGKSA